MAKNNDKKKKNKNNKGAGDNGKPESPAPTPVVVPSRIPAEGSKPAVAPTERKLNPGERLAFDHLMLKRELLEQKVANLKMRREQLAVAGQMIEVEAVSLDKESATNIAERKHFVTAMGFDASQPVDYVDGVLRLIAPAKA